MRSSPSIRRRLLLLLVTFTTVVWAIELLALYHETRRQLEHLQDAQLRQAARLLLIKAAHEAREHSVGDEEDDGLEDGGADVFVWDQNDYERALFFQIFDRRGLLYRAPGMPSSLRLDSSKGFETRSIDGEAWRIFSLWDDAHDIGVQVAEPSAIRQQMVSSIGRRLLVPGLAALPLLGLAIWFAVGHSLRPLQVIASDLRQRRDDDLRPIVTPAPVEVAPLLDALNQLLERLRQAFLRARKFTADAAHELRTPLAALKTQAQVAMGATSEGERRHALEQMLVAADRATRLVQQLLGLARLEPDAAMGSPARVDLCEVAKSIVQELAPLALRKNVELGLDGCGVEPATLTGYRDLLVVLLRNLVDNAIRYVPAGGHVDVVVARLPAGLALQVADDGPGIAPAERERMFEPFVRGRHPDVPGSGLGLSIVKRVADLHGAEIHLEEGLGGRGLCVRVVFTGLA